MALASRAMAAVGAAAGVPAREVGRYASAAAALGDVAHLNRLHWDAAHGRYADYGLHTEDVELGEVAVEPTAAAIIAAATSNRPMPPPTRAILRRETGAPPTLRHVPAFGYVSLFPLLMKLLPPDSPELGRTLEQLSRAELLWTPAGLRSLAANASLHGARNTEHDPPYWRGSIWVNVNFLALRALAHYAATPGPHASAAGGLLVRLQAAVGGNVAAQYDATGYFWEQYREADGGGAGVHPFTGWTALFALIATGDLSE
jgi:mannosyl-oligosaccharide glucosidase